MDFCASSLLSGQVVLYWERELSLLVSAVESYVHVAGRDVMVSVFAHHDKGFDLVPCE